MDIFHADLDNKWIIGAWRIVQPLLIFHKRTKRIFYSPAGYVCLPYSIEL